MSEPFECGDKVRVIATKKEGTIVNATGIVGQPPMHLEVQFGNDGTAKAWAKPHELELIQKAPKPAN